VLRPRMHTNIRRNRGACLPAAAGRGRGKQRDTVMHTLLPSALYVATSASSHARAQPDDAFVPPSPLLATASHLSAVALAKEEARHAPPFATSAG
jgi:hypothetical protein